MSNVDYVKVRNEALWMNVAIGHFFSARRLYRLLADHVIFPTTTYNSAHANDIEILRYEDTRRSVVHEVPFRKGAKSLGTFW